MSSVEQAPASEQMKQATVTRRLFLTSGAACLAAGSSLLSVFPEPILAAESRREPMSPQEFKSRLRGPILSLPTPFSKTYDVDYAGVRKMVAQALEGGIRNFAMTDGNSQYRSQTYQEVKDLTQVFCEAVGDAGTCIAAAGDWWTGQTVDYVRFAESVGADAVQVKVPQGMPADICVEYMRTVAAATNLGLVIGGNPSIDILEQLVEKIDSAVAMKEDSRLTYYITAQRKFGERLTIFAGGPKYRFLIAWPYGAVAFYSLYSTFAPQIPMAFWKAIQAGARDEAYRIVNTYEHPLMDRYSHAFWRAALAHFGIAQRYLRPPKQSFTDQQMEDVARFFEELGLRPS